MDSALKSVDFSIDSATFSGKIGVCVQCSVTLPTNTEGERGGCFVTGVTGV